MELQIRKLSKTYPNGVEALKDVTLTIPRSMYGLLVYGSDPGWSYSDMRGLEPFLGPWLLFKLYWAAWALLLAVASKLLWPRGTERGVGPRRRAAVTAAAAAALVLTFGGLIFYNTRVLYASHAAPSGQEWQAEYERRIRLPARDARAFAIDFALPRTYLSTH